MSFEATLNPCGGTGPSKRSFWRIARNCPGLRENVRGLRFHERGPASAPLQHVLLLSWEAAGLLRLSPSHRSPRLIAARVDAIPA